MLQGVELLYALGAINDQCELTQPLGLQMAEFPLNPMFARMLLLSGEISKVLRNHTLGVSSTLVSERGKILVIF